MNYKVLLKEFVSVFFASDCISFGLYVVQSTGQFLRFGPSGLALFSNLESEFKLDPYKNGVQVHSCGGIKQTNLSLLC